jgi:hypothetical protein
MKEMRINSNKSEVDRRNEEIAKFLGWYLENPENPCWYYTGEYAKYVAYDQTQDQFRQLPFHKYMNYLMKAFNKVREMPRTFTGTITGKTNEIFIDKFEMKLDRITVFLCQRLEHAWRHYNGMTTNSELGIVYIVGENVDTWEEALYMAISDIATVVNKYRI